MSALGGGLEPIARRLFRRFIEKEPQRREGTLIFRQSRLLLYLYIFGLLALAVLLEDAIPKQDYERAAWGSAAILGGCIYGFIGYFNNRLEIFQDGLLRFTDFFGRKTEFYWVNVEEVYQDDELRIIFKLANGKKVKIHYYIRAEGWIYRTAVANLPDFKTVKLKEDLGKRYKG
jgi:hypothetical protein